MVRANSPLSLLRQEISLRKLFPEAAIQRFRDESLIWTCSLTPSPLSQTYRIQLEYHHKEGLKVFVLEPRPLRLAKGKKVLPHVYSTPAQQLCLYYPDGMEWNRSMLYTRTIIPWTSEWLAHYEVWVVTGRWHGGGSDHGSDVEDIHIPARHVF